MSIGNNINDRSGNIATANKIENMKLESYRAMKQHEKETVNSEGKKAKKKKK